MVLSFGIIIVVTVTMFVLFIPKIIIVYFRPQENIFNFENDKSSNAPTFNIPLDIDVNQVELTRLIDNIKGKIKKVSSKNNENIIKITINKFPNYLTNNS